MAAEWGYGETDGPRTWANNFLDARGTRQSPIDIVTADAEYDSKLKEKPLKIDYTPEAGMCIGNTGASVKVDCEKDSTLTGGPLGEKVYKLIQFHLHWGDKDDKGAEHTIDGKVYSAELHLVHWNSTDYKSFAEAAKESDGLAVLCMFIKVGNPHKEFELVSRELCNITIKGGTCKATRSIDPARLLPADIERYWTYPGSLTTPPCFESVQFILFKDPIQFSAEQMKALRSLHFGDKIDSPCMVNNFRPTCPLGTRQVLASFSR